MARIAVRRQGRMTRITCKCQRTYLEKEEADTSSHNSNEFTTQVFDSDRSEDNDDRLKCEDYGDTDSNDSSARSSLSVAEYGVGTGAHVSDTRNSDSGDADESDWTSSDESDGSSSEFRDDREVIEALTGVDTQSYSSTELASEIHALNRALAEYEHLGSGSDFEEAHGDDEFALLFSALGAT
ncbi:hypothetical protein MPER_04216 [Moniliophthora perniciosa FA553]|nr:hypothetical protein MPER_04216 [Moniliophthora perniciosa FA553]